MTPLFYAVYHGCRAGLHVECRRDIYRDRILHGNEGYLWRKLGAFGTQLSLLATFFEVPWTQPVAASSHQPINPGFFDQPRRVHPRRRWPVGRRRRAHAGRCQRCWDVGGLDERSPRLRQPQRTPPHPWQRTRSGQRGLPSGRFRRPHSRRPLEVVHSHDSRQRLPSARGRRGGHTSLSGSRAGSSRESEHANRILHLYSQAISTATSSVPSRGQAVQKSSDGPPKR